MTSYFSYFVPSFASSETKEISDQGQDQCQDQDQNQCQDQKDVKNSFVIVELGNFSRDKLKHVEQTKTHTYVNSELKDFFQNKKLKPVIHCDNIKINEPTTIHEKALRELIVTRQKILNKEPKEQKKVQKTDIYSLENLDLTILIREGCEWCKKTIKLLEQENQLKYVTLIDISSPRGIDIIKKFDIKPATPTFINKFTDRIIYGHQNSIEDIIKKLKLDQFINIIRVFFDRFKEVNYILQKDNCAMREENFKLKEENERLKEENAKLIERQQLLCNWTSTWEIANKLKNTSI